MYLFLYILSDICERVCVFIHMHVYGDGIPLILYYQSLSVCTYVYTLQLGGQLCPRDQPSPTPLRHPCAGTHLLSSKTGVRIPTTDKVRFYYANAYYSLRLSSSKGGKPNDIATQTQKSYFCIGKAICIHQSKSYISVCIEQLVQLATYLCNTDYNCFVGPLQYLNLEVQVTYSKIRKSEKTHKILSV